MIDISSTDLNSSTLNRRVKKDKNLNLNSKILFSKYLYKTLKLFY
jgi:hypothetical protein